MASEVKRGCDAWVILRPKVLEKSREGAGAAPPKLNAAARAAAGDAARAGAVGPKLKAGEGAGSAGPKPKAAAGAGVLRTLRGGGSCRGGAAGGGLTSASNTHDLRGTGHPWPLIQLHLSFRKRGGQLPLPHGKTSASETCCRPHQKPRALATRRAREDPHRR